VNALRLPPDVLIVPGAADIRVVETSWGQQIIVYRVTELPSAWMDLVGQRLEARGWLPVHSDIPYTGTHTYRHVAVAGPFALIQDAVQPLPNHPRKRCHLPSLARCPASAHQPLVSAQVLQPTSRSSQPNQALQRISLCLEHGHRCTWA